MKELANIKLSAVCRNLILIGTIALVSGNSAFAQNQELFASPEDAVKALKSATAANDHAALTTIFGPRIRDFVSGDDVADKNHFAEFSSRLTLSSKIGRSGDNKAELLIGSEDWPFAAPLVKVGDKWRFDTDAGVEELLNRRIGMNEYDAMYVCQAYALAQFEYFNGDDWDGDQVSEYAQKIASSAGKRDGLFWETVVDGEDESPLGPLFAYATAEGYKTKKGTVQTATPFHGYYFKVLFSQGPSAPGGKFGYIINGNMIAGFALVAYPANWGNSGVMTFMVNQEGRVYEKNLGPRTGAIASAMTEYDPDATWALSGVD